MHRAFVYAFWGNQDDPESRSHKTRQDFVHAAHRERTTTPINPVVYVWGTDNHEYVKSLETYRTVLVNKNPMQFSEQYASDRVWRHKIEAWRIALDDFDQIIHLDVDVELVKPIPEDLWERLEEKQAFQATLLQYRRIKSPWRKEDRRKRPSAAFVYCRDQSIPESLGELVESYPWGFPADEETAMAWWTDEQLDGWKGVQSYAKHFEPYCFALRKKHGYDPSIPGVQEILDSKDVVFTV